VNTILAVFLAATISAGNAHQAAEATTDQCDTYVNEAAQQVLWACETRPANDTRQPELQQNLPEHGPGSSTLTVPESAPDPGGMVAR
jgi:hypothetical protein